MKKSYEHDSSYQQKIYHNELQTIYDCAHTQASG